MTLFLLLAALAVCIGLTRYVAVRKHRDPNYWTLVAVLLGPLALLAVLVMPAKQ